MKRSFRVWTVLLLAAVAMAAGLSSQVVAQKAEGKKRRVTRLPAHYAKVVTEDQRAEIYAIQEEFEPKLAKLRDELKALVGERDAAVEKVLSATQRKEVEKLRADAAARRRAALSKADPDEDEKPAKPSKSKKAA